jgi:uncharacterized membrane protein
MNTSSSGASGRQTLVIVLAVIGILGIIAAIMYISGAANSIHIMVGSVHKGHHVIRFIVSLVVGAAFLVGAYIARSRTPSARGNSPAKSATSGV